MPLAGGSPAVRSCPTPGGFQTRLYGDFVVLRFAGRLFAGGKPPPPGFRPRIGVRGMLSIAGKTRRGVVPGFSIAVLTWDFGSWIPAFAGMTNGGAV